eukprot:7056502-Karenia_brevis.AAC.1
MSQSAAAPAMSSTSPMLSSTSPMSSEPAYAYLPAGSMPPIRDGSSASSALMGTPQQRVQPTTTPVPSTLETIDVPS